MPKPQDDTAINESLNRWRADPLPEHGKALLTTLGPTIDYGIRRYGGVASGPAMRTKAKLLTFEAATRYDPRTGVPFKPYLLQHLQGLQRFSGVETAAGHVPERLRLASDRIEKANRLLSDQLGRDPSDAELGDHLFMNPKRIARVRSLALGALPESVVENGAGSVDNDLWRQFVYHSLPPRDQAIMEATLGMNNRPVMSTAELAKRYKISPAAVSQHKTRIQRMLDEVMEKR